MKKVRFLWRTVWILCVSIIVVIIMFFKQNNPDMEKKTEEYENVVKIMAPYTTHDQRNALNTVARKYEGMQAQKSRSNIFQEKIIKEKSHCARMNRIWQTS